MSCRALCTGEKGKGKSGKPLHFNEGGDYGNHEVLIGKLVNRMI